MLDIAWPLAKRRGFSTKWIYNFINIIWRKKVNFKQKQAGFSAIELLGILVVLAILAGFVINMLKSTNESADAQVFQADFAILASMISKARGPQSFNIAGIDVDEVIALDKTTTVTVYDGAGNLSMALASRFPVSAIAADDCLSTNDCYIVTVGGFADQQCSDIIRRLWGVSYSIDVNGTNVKANSSSNLDGTAGTAISTGCSELETNGTTNELEITKILNT